MENTSFAPVVNTNVTRARAPFLPAPERDLSGVYPRSKRTPPSNNPFQTFLSLPRDNAILRGATTQPHHNHLSQKELSFPKPQTTLAQASSPGCSLWTPTALPLVTLFCGTAAAAAAKSLQSCPTLCDPIDGSPPGSPIPGILQARTLEWVAISFSNA